jgi:putative oxidoreductase
MAQDEEIMQTPNAQRAISSLGTSAEGATSNIKRRTSNLLWRLVDLIIGGIFIYAGAIKVLDPVQFANDIDNYKILPWTVAVGLAFYFPWLEILCGLALILRRLYLGGLSILIALVAVFLVATIAAKVRGLDITCGCFGHVSQNWNFPAHLALDLAILGALLLLSFRAVSGNRRKMSPNSCEMLTRTVVLMIAVALSSIVVLATPKG